MNASLQSFVNTGSNAKHLNVTTVQADQLFKICRALGIETEGLFANTVGAGAQGSGPQGSFTLAELQADPYDLTPSDAILFRLGVRVGADVKLIDVGPALEILNNTGTHEGTNTQPSTRIEEFLGEAGIGVNNPQLAAYTALVKIPAIQQAIATALGLPASS